MICDLRKDQDHAWKMKFSRELCERHKWEYDEGISSVMVCEQCYFEETK
tara:strand:- start:227 stop:373 length:147 start_codon:yes stop_codon:yes gene_type:complete